MQWLFLQFFTTFRFPSDFESRFDFFIKRKGILSVFPH